MKYYILALKNNLTLIGKIADICWAEDIECFHAEVCERGLIIGTFLTIVQMAISISVITLLIICALITYPIISMYSVIRDLVGKPITYEEDIYWDKMTEYCLKYIDDELDKHYK